MKRAKSWKIIDRIGRGNHLLRQCLLIFNSLSALPLCVTLQIVVSFDISFHSLDLHFLPFSHFFNSSLSKRRLPLPPLALIFFFFFLIHLTCMQCTRTRTRRVSRRFVSTLTNFVLYRNVSVYVRCLTIKTLRTNRNIVQLARISITVCGWRFVCTRVSGARRRGITRDSEKINMLVYFKHATNAF